MSNLGQLQCRSIDDDWGHPVSGLVPGYDQNVLIESIFIILQNGLLYYQLPFYYPTSVEHMDLIASENISMPTKESCLNRSTSGSNIWIVKWMTLISPSKAEFLLFLYYTSAGLHPIRSCDFSSAYRLETRYRFIQSGARWPSNGYWILKLKNIQWWFHRTKQIYMIVLIGFTGLSGLSNRLRWCNLYLSLQLLNRCIWCMRMLHQIESIVYGL